MLRRVLLVTVAVAGFMAPYHELLAARELGFGRMNSNLMNLNS